MSRADIAQSTAIEPPPDSRSRRATRPLPGDCESVRIVAAADEARRRIEEELHEGAQQRLVVAALMLARAEARARGTSAEPFVTEALDQLREGLGELGRLAHGIHPTALQYGLAVALGRLVARSPVPVDLRVAEDRVAPAAEAAIYFTVLEALQNVAEHADANRVTVDVEVVRGLLVADVTDDGVGGARPEEGSALSAVSDRLEAVGGSLSIESPPRIGTTVGAYVPLSSR